MSKRVKQGFGSECDKARRTKTLFREINSNIVGEPRDGTGKKSCFARKIINNKYFQTFRTFCSGWLYNTRHIGDWNQRYRSILISLTFDFNEIDPIATVQQQQQHRNCYRFWPCETFKRSIVVVALKTMAHYPRRTVCVCVVVGVLQENGDWTIRKLTCDQFDKFPR